MSLSLAKMEARILNTFLKGDVTTLVILIACAALFLNEFTLSLNVSSSSYLYYWIHLIFPFVPFVKFLESLAKSAFLASTICNLQTASSAIEELKILIRESVLHKIYGEKC